MLNEQVTSLNRTLRSLGRVALKGKEREVELLPFYQLHRKRYAAYWDLHTPESWSAKSA